jgi:hypothetical protein
MRNKSLTTFFTLAAPLLALNCIAATVNGTIQGTVFDVTKFLNFCKASGFNQSSSIPEGNHVHCNSLIPGTNYPNR